MHSTYYVHIKYFKVHHRQIRVLCNIHTCRLGLASVFKDVFQLFGSLLVEHIHPLNASLEAVLFKLQYIKIITYNIMLMESLARLRNAKFFAWRYG